MCSGAAVIYGQPRVTGDHNIENWVLHFLLLMVRVIMVQERIPPAPNYYIHITDYQHFIFCESTIVNPIEYCCNIMIKVFSHQILYLIFSGSPIPTCTRVSSFTWKTHILMSRSSSIALLNFKNYMFMTSMHAVENVIFTDHRSCGRKSRPVDLKRYRSVCAGHRHYDETGGWFKTLRLRKKTPTNLH